MANPASTAQQRLDAAIAWAKESEALAPMSGFNGVFDASLIRFRELALTYRVPMAQDLPANFVSITQEQGHGPGPFGAKGMGEGGILPVAPAIANAVFNATGARITELPLTPARVKAALERG